MAILKLTVLVDTAANFPFVAEFGLSLYLSFGCSQFLFDTGAGQALPLNASLLGLDISRIGQVFLSHGHADHTGGLACLNPLNIFCLHGVDCMRVSVHPGQSPHSLSMPDSSKSILGASECFFISSFREIADGIYSTGPIPRLSGEDCGGSFFHDMECTEFDAIADEQALLLDNGTLVTGCCHAGIINTINYCKIKHPEIQIRTIVGGLHLVHADEKRLVQTADFLQKMQIQTIIPMHCTGDEAIAFLKKSLPNTKFYLPQVGDSLIIN